MENSKISEREERVRKLEELKKLNINPYPAKAKRTHTIGQILADFKKLEKDGTEIIIVGRLRSLRGHGNLTFANLEDASGKIQIAISKKELTPPTPLLKGGINPPNPPLLKGGMDAYKIFTKLIDMGDFVEIRGICFKTHKGENSVMAKKWKILTKALRPLPDKYKGLQDEEEKFRKRYLDILFNPEARAMIEKKAIFWNSMREFLIKKGFLEVETPVLENTAGGADARPFATHHNALDIDVYLRISMGELWQKRLMVAGFEKTFEIGRQFRNEGMSPEHLQDYTQMEFYWAYADYKDGMKLVEELYKHIAEQAFGTLKFKIGKFNVDLGKKWEIYDYSETIKKCTGVDVLNAEIKQIEKKLKELKVDYDKKGFNLTRAIDNLWKYCRKNIGGPGFLINVPVFMEPLAKRIEGSENFVQRFQVILAGSEIGKGYSELNDPLDQMERFSEQQRLRDAGDDEAQMEDDEFVEALEYGMPPTCGFGISERLFSFLMNRPARECQIFPLMKPKTVNLTIKHILEQIKIEELGIDHKDAKKLLDKNIKNKITKMHCVESEAIMRGLAKHFGEDEEKWGIIGLLHDIDWELTKDNTKEHCVKMVGILKEAGASDFLIETIVSHGYGQEKCGAGPDKKRTTKLQHCLAAAETLTGLIIASALTQPDKKLASVKLNSLKKKYKNKKFAANCNRDIIKECEKAGLSLDEFLEIGLKALQGIANDLGM